MSHLDSRLSRHSSRRPSRGRRVVAWFLAQSGGSGFGRIRWSRVVGVMLALTVTGYTSLAAAAFCFVRFHREIATVRFVDLALPWHWENYRIARGDHYLARAKRLLAEGNHREALRLARAGLAQSPANRDGRLLLVELLGGAGRPELARDILLDGLRQHRRDAIYLKQVLLALLQQQDDARVVAMAREQLPTEEPGAETARLLALAAATALYHRGSYDQAEDFLQKVPRLPESRDGRFLAAKIEHDRGYRELSLLQLRRLAADFPHDEEVQRELVGQLRGQGLADEARRASLVFQIAHPRLAGPRIALLHAYRQEGDQPRVDREVDAILRDFAGDRAALLSLADAGANLGDVALVGRIAAHAGGRGMPVEAFALLAVEAAIVARDHRWALAAIRGLLAEEGRTGRQHRALLDSFQAIAHLGLGDPASARVFLDSFLGQPNLRAENLLAVAERFAALEGGRYAWQTLAQAVEIDPLNQAALARLIELDLALNRVDVLAAHVQRFVQMRRPSPDILRVVQQRLGSDLFLFSSEAPAALAAVRRALTGANSPRQR